MSLCEGQVCFIILGMPLGFGILISVAAGSPLLGLTFRLTDAVAVVTSLLPWFLLALLPFSKSYLKLLCTS